MGASIRHELHVSCDVCGVDANADMGDDETLDCALDVFIDTTEWAAPLFSVVTARAEAGRLLDEELLDELDGGVAADENVLLCPKCAVRFGYVNETEDE